MTLNTLLERLKLSLPMTSTAYDELLTTFLQAAIAKFDADISDECDQTLVILYAGWLWRSLSDPGLSKPPALQMAINDRTVAQSAGGGNV